MARTTKPASDTQPLCLDTSAVTRVEVIDSNGRSFARHGYFNVKLSLQDDGRTLKVFCDDCMTPMN